VPPAAPPPARPPPATAAPEPAAKTPVAEGFMIQLGSFSEEENARRLAQRVSTYGYKPAVSTFKSSGRVMWRVRIGPKPTRAQAEAEASSLSAHGFVAQVVSAD
jgi:DedD protein